MSPNFSSWISTLCKDADRQQRAEAKRKKGNVRRLDMQLLEDRTVPTLFAGTLTPPVATEGVPFAFTTVFSFTDDNLAETPADLTAAIGTGDGTTLTTGANPTQAQIVQTGVGTFDLQMAYTYTDALSAATFNVVVTDASGGITAFQGPNTYGYHAFDQAAQTLDTSGAFTIIQATDDSSVAVSLGTNSFNFYGTTYSNIFVSSNGLITFSSADSSYTNQNLSSSPSQPAIAVYWDDLFGPSFNTAADPMVRGKFVDLNADTVSDILILEWHTEHIDFRGNGNPATIDAVLQLNTGATAGDILLNYPDLDFGNATVNNGASATVGIKNSNGAGADPLLVSFNSAGTHATTGNAILLSDLSIAASNNSFSVTDAPVSLDLNTGTSVLEGITGNVIDNTMLSSSTYPSDPVSELVYTVTAGPSKGT